MLRSRLRFGLVTAVALVIFVAPLSGRAANGDNLRTIIADRTGTQCASLDASGNHGSIGTGIAFDGTNLLLSCWPDGSLVAVDPADGSQVSVQFPTGITPNFGALAWDNGRMLLWACSGGNDVGTIDLAANAFTSKFASAGCVDGLAYDSADDTIWSSDDVASTVQHYTVDGTLIAEYPVSLGSCGNSGIAVGGPKLYLANNGCSEIYEVAKDFSSSTLFASFPARLEDLECDNVTFVADGKAAIWSNDAYDNILNAWEIPNGACVFGGGGGECVEDGLAILNDTPAEGVASGTVHNSVEPLVAGIDEGLADTVHIVNCDLVVPLEDAVDGLLGS